VRDSDRRLTGKAARNAAITESGEATSDAHQRLEMLELDGAANIEADRLAPTCTSSGRAES
jgi:hypothetical protein